MLPLAASDITLSVGDIDVTGLVPGDKVYIPVTIDAITPGEEISGWQFFIWHDQLHITWDGSITNPSPGIHYLSPFFPNSAAAMFNVNNQSELVYLWGDGFTFADLSNETLPYTIIEFTFTFHGGIDAGDWSFMLWGTEGKSPLNQNSKGTTEVYDGDFDYFSLKLHQGGIYNPCACYSWQGYKSNDWFDGDNWVSGHPPTFEDVSIGWAPFMPVINDGFASTGDLDIDGFSFITIKEQGGLTVDEILYNNGNIILQSDNAGKSGTLITNESITGSGTFEFDRNLFCSGTLPGSTDPYGWHYLAAPFEGFTTDMIPDYFINAWDQSTGTWMHYDPTVYGPCVAWMTTYLNPLNAWSINFDLTYPDPNCFPPLPPGTGDHVEFIASASQVHTGDYSRNLGYGSSGYQMWNMVSNPYPAGLDVNSLSWGPNTVQVVYLYNGCLGNYEYWAAGMGSYVVPPTQGFFVETTGPDMFSVFEANRSHYPEPILKNGIKELLTLQATGNNRSDKLYIRFANDVTTGFDLNGDAHKLFAETDGLPQIYTIAGDEKLAINALPETATVPMGFTANGSGTYNIEAIESSDFETVILEDLFSGVQTDLMMESYSFHFNSGDDPDRFLIHFEPGISVQRANDISIWSSGHTVFVKRIEGSGDIGVFNLLGQPILKIHSEPKKVNQIKLNDLHGCFIVKVSTGSFTNTEKVIIK